ncbi:hypothetical protein [Saccharopolyspora sp. 5N708]|uniref:hypothetical protein n=1 Tax=Saccharopolyspora sp. 5N708 TaxID=3457424 RepID=UPI003FD236AE
MFARIAGSIVAGILAIAGLFMWVATIDSILRYGSGGVALPFALFWTAVWLLLCWAAAGMLVVLFGMRSRAAKVTLWTAVVITVIGLVIWGIGLGMSN